VRRVLAAILMLAVAALDAAADDGRRAPAAAEGHGPDAHHGMTADGMAAKGMSRGQLLDGLLARLHMAGDDREAMVVAKSIRGLWARPGSPSAALLMQQASKALKGGDALTALRILDLAARRWPKVAEIHNRRAIVHYMAGDLNDALKALDEALALEPRHFEALALKGAILQEMKRYREAMEAYEQALLIYPRLPPAKQALRELHLKMDQDI